MKLVRVKPGFGGDKPAVATWSVLDAAIGDADGLCFYKHPLLGADSECGPDFVALPRGFQPLVVRCLPVQLDEIEAVDEDHWHYDGDERDSPLLQLEDFAADLAFTFNRERPLRDRLQPQCVLALPNIARESFVQRFGAIDDEHVILWRESKTAQLAPVELGDRHWELAMSVFQAAATLGRPAHRITAQEAQATMGKALRQLEQRIALFDDEQLEAAYQIAPGPQIIRGLAGTGKTVLLALKAAVIHAHLPEARVLFSFWARSLYTQAEKLITQFFRRIRPDADPDFDLLQIRHAWGSSERRGVYRDLCSGLGLPPLGLEEARAQDRNPFRACCMQVLQREIPNLYDFVLVDEAQDLPREFFTVLKRMTAPEHKICYAYDQLQRLTDLETPDLTQLLDLDVDWGTPYDDGIEKDVVLYKSYRCHRDVLLLAHGLGLGTHNPGGCVQMIRDAGSWDAIGYELVSGSLSPGKKVELLRPAENSPNDIGQFYKGDEPLIETKVFADREAEFAWIATSIDKAVNQEGPLCQGRCRLV